MPHVLHLDPKTNKLTHYVPPEKLAYPWYSMFGFDGYIKTGDPEECVPMKPLCMFFGTLALAFFGAIWLLRRGAIRKRIKSF